jgi:hypothetical protein
MMKMKNEDERARGWCDNVMQDIASHGFTGPRNLSEYDISVGVAQRMGMKLVRSLSIHREFACGNLRVSLFKIQEHPIILSLAAANIRTASRSRVSLQWRGPRIHDLQHITQFHRTIGVLLISRITTCCQLLNCSFEAVSIHNDWDVQGLEFVFA